MLLRKAASAKPLMGRPFGPTLDAEHLDRVRTAPRYLRTGRPTSRSVAEGKAISIRRRVASVDGEGEAPLVVADAADPPPGRRRPLRLGRFVPPRGRAREPGHSVRVRDLHRSIGRPGQRGPSPPGRRPHRPRLHHVLRRGLCPPRRPPLFLGTRESGTITDVARDGGQSPRLGQSSRALRADHGNGPDRSGPADDVVNRTGHSLRRRELHAHGAVRPHVEETRQAGLAALEEAAASRSRDPAHPHDYVIRTNCAWGTPLIQRIPSSDTNPARFAASMVCFPTKFPIVASWRWEAKTSSETTSPS